MKIFEMKKSGMIVSQILLTFANYLLWMIILKPLGAVESVTSISSSAAKMGFGSGNAHQEKIIHNTATGMAFTYGLAKTTIYLLTTGLFIFLISYKGAYKNNTNGKIILFLSAAALVADFINMTIIPSFPLYMLATLMLLISRDKEENVISNNIEKIAA